MNNRFDQLIKRLVRECLSPGGRVETEAEVTPDALRIDVWFVPHAGRAPRVLAPLGLLGRMARSSCTLEPYHRTPSGDQAADCIAKHRFFWRGLARRKPRPPMPMQWIVCSGRPSAALAGLGFRRSRWGRGIYDGPVLTRTRIVVVSELPTTRDTLLVRLMGARTTLSRAIVDVQALPDEAPERRLALPILIQLRLEITSEPAKQTTIDREFLMNTREVNEYLAALEERGRSRGREEGREEALAEVLLIAYTTRFGTPPAAFVAAVKRADGPVARQRLLALVITKSADEIAAAVRKPRSKPAVNKTATRRSATPRRGAAAR